MSGSNDLSAREMEVLALAWQCMNVDPKIDYNKLAELTGYTLGSASMAFGKIRRKLKAKAASSSGTPVTPKKTGVNVGGRPKSSATPKSGKRGAADSTPAGTPTGTPSKRSKKVNKPVAAEENEDDEDDEAFTTFHIKKEEMADINADANTFFNGATVYAAAGN